MKKVKLFNYFKEYLESNQLGVSEVSSLFIKPNKEKSSLERTNLNQAYVSKWITIDKTIFFKMNSKVIQVIFKDSDFLIIDPFEREINYIDPKGKRYSFSPDELPFIENEQISSRINYVQNQLSKIWQKREEK